MKAANVVMASGRYAFTTDFRSLFGSQDLAASKEIIMYRKYDASVAPAVTHHVASYSNTTESQAPAPNLS